MLSSKAKKFGNGRHKNTEKGKKGEKEVKGVKGEGMKIKKGRADCRIQGSCCLSFHYYMHEKNCYTLE